MNYIIRKGERKDCFGIAHVVTVAWNETYQGIVPNDFLENLKNDEKERAKALYDNYEINNYHELVLEINNEIVGFVRFGIAEDNEFENCGEIYALYIIAKYKGNGFGRKLVEEAIQEIKKFDCDKMVISCLKGNPSNEFYKHMGGKYIKDRLFEKLNLLENVYYYENI